MIGTARIGDLAGDALAFAGEALTLTLTRAFAPGAPIRVRLVIDGADFTVEARAIGSKRRDDGTFEVRVRLVNLSREDRLRLEATNATR